MKRQTSTTRQLLVIAVLITPILLAAPHPVHAAPVGAYSDHILTIIMENSQRDQIMPSQPYQTQFANTHSQLANYVQTSDHGSLSNYIGLISGQDPSWSHCNTHPSACPSLPNGGSMDPTIMDRLDSAGLSWKSYMEDMSQNCYDPHAEYSTGPGGGTYYPRHNPFIYYRTVINNPSQCAKNIPAGNYCISAASTILQVSSCINNLLADLNSASPPNFMWLTPNGCNQSHDCNGLSGRQTKAVGDKYLSILLSLILSTTTFTSPGSNAALFVTYDECGTCSTRPLYAVWAGPRVSTLYTSSIAYNHYSLLMTLENNWNLPSLGAGDVSALSMTEFFNPIVSGGFNVQAWNQAAVFPSTATITPGTNGILDTRVSNIATSYAGSYYAVGLLGTADWSPPGPLIPGSYLSIDGTFTSLNVAGGPVTNFKVATTLYFYFSTPQSGTGCDRFKTNISWLDVQVQFSNYDSQTGGYQPLGSYIGCSGPKSISYRETVANTLPGQDFALSNFGITALYRRALTTQHLPSTVPAKLVGVEVGVAGYNVNDLSASYRHLRIGPAILSNNPKDSDWKILNGNWTQPGGKLQGAGVWPEIVSTAIFPADRTVSILARTIVMGPNNWDTAWVRAKYVDENNKITMFLRKDKYLEIDVKKNGIVHHYVSPFSTGKSPWDWHSFRIVFSGSNIKGYLDGTVYLDILDPIVGIFPGSRILLTSSGTSESQFGSTTIS